MYLLLRLVDGLSVELGEFKMDQTTFISRLVEEHNLCVQISKAKNADYSTTNDAFLNFRGALQIGVDPAQAILVRMSDKMARIGNLLKKKKAAVADESVADTLRDLSNYALILLLFLEETGKEQS